MSALMYSQMGLSLVGSWGQYATASIQADLQGKIQDYQNTMNKLSAARSLNAVTVNEIRTRDASIQADQMIQKQAMQDQGQAELNAAAAGVMGNSVEMAAKDLKASAGRASYAVKRQEAQQLSEMRNQRKSIAIQAITGENVQVIPKPSIGSMLLGMGTNLLSIYDSNQPEGDRILGP